MNRSESKYFNTARYMNEAFISLLEKKDYEYITIKEICEKAGVNRSTFYLHYETMDDLVEEIIENINKELLDSYTSENVINLDKINEYSLEQLILITPKILIPYLEFIKKNKLLYKVVISKPTVLKAKDSFSKRYNDVILPIIKRFGVTEREYKYTLVYYINGLFAMIAEWIRNDCNEDIDYLANLMSKVVVGDKKI